MVFQDWKHLSYLGIIYTPSRSGWPLRYEQCSYFKLLDSISEVSPILAKYPKIKPDMLGQGLKCAHCQAVLLVWWCEEFLTNKIMYCWSFIGVNGATHTHTTHTHTRLTALCPGLPGWANTRKVKPVWILLEQRDSKWQWHQLVHMQVCTLLQTNNHASTPSLKFLQAGCPFCRPTNSVKALKG